MPEPFTDPMGEAQPSSPDDMAGWFSEALEAISEEPGALSDQLEFYVHQAITKNAPEACYGKDLIRCAAVAKGSAQREACRRLKAKYKNDFSVPNWQADVRDMRAELVTAADDQSGLIKSEGNALKSNLANAIVQLRRSGIKLAYDLFSAKVMIQGACPWADDPEATTAWRDIDGICGAEYLQRHGINVSDTISNQAAYYLAWQKRFHPVRDWLNGLRWDGEPRLDSWMVDYLGAEDSPYIRAVGAKWVMSAVARALRPGVKCDYMIVLEGEQRQGKSRALRAITNGHIDGDRGVQWFRDGLPDIEHKDIGSYMQGVWIIEVAELEAIRGKQWTKVKSFISSQTDSFRRAYGHNLEDYPRQCVFAGSTNEEHWGGDPTGLTRFWPVRVTKVNVDGIIKNREQLWAEAKFRFDEGEKHYLPDNIERVARVVQADRAPDDPWLERIQVATAQFSQGAEFSLVWLMTKLNCQGDRDVHRITRALSILGYERVLDGKVKRYRKP